MLNGALGVTNTTSINFSDVPSSEWYYTNVRKAVATGYTSGYLDNTFKPNGKITRQEAAVMISKIIPPYQGSASLASLGDNANIADWARAAATKVYAAGYIKGDTNNLYRPTASLSRAEAAAILTRLIEGETIVTADTNVSSTTTLRDRIYVNDLTINKALLDNDLTLNGCLILGNLYVNGGGNNTVTLTDTLARNMVVAKTTGDVRVLLTGYSTVNKASLTYGAKLEHSSLRGEGFKVIDLNGSSLSTQQVDLVGSFEQVNVNNASIINSASGTIANLNITSSASSDIVKLSGTYTNVTIEAKAYLELLSGRISNLTINSAAASSTVKMSSGTTVTRANVDGKTAFTGTGTISTMYANVNDITYETKPNTITKASSVTRPPTLSNDITAPSPTFTPIDGATGIAQNTAIKIVFDEAIYKSNGSSVTTSDIPNIIQIREDTSTGTSRTYSASISTDKKTITITPSAVLQTSQDYYIIILSGTIEDTLGNENAKVTSHFVTGTQDLAAPTVTFSPVSGTTNVAITSTIVLTFNEPIYKYSGGAAIVSTDFDSGDTKDIIILKTNNSSGTDVPYTATVTGTTTKVVTITPNSSLSNAAIYYVAVNTNKIKDSTGNVTPLTSATFTTVALDATAPVLSSQSASLIASTTATLNYTSSEAGTYYYLVYAAADTSPSAITIKAQGTALKKGTGSASASANTISLTGLTESTAYKAYIIVEDASLNKSNVSEIALTTIAPDLTAPVLSSQSASSIAQTTATLNYTSSEAGTYYYLVYAAADTSPSAVTIKAQGTALKKGTGSASASTNTINLTGLTHTTAYKAYIIVEDASLNKSNVSEIALTTIPPDLTAPTLSSQSASSIAQTTATLNYTADEAGTYYYLVYAAADTSPSAVIIKEQGSAIKKGTGVASASANTISLTGLTHSTAYKAYIIVEDASLNKSNVTEIALTTIAPDVTAPILSSVNTTDIAQSTANLNFTSDEAGTYYYLVYAAADAPPSADAIKAQTTGLFKGTGSASASTKTINLTGLTSNTAYKAYVIVEDASLNKSIVSTLEITTTI
jgi:methionine-rich copper-binding protein CopC